MSHFISRRRAMVGTAAAWAPVAWPAWSQSFPARTITLIVPSLAGGGTDAIARALGQELNRPGF